MRRVLLLSALIVLAACNRSENPDPPKVEVTASKEASPLAQGAAVAGPRDARLLDELIAHHEQGLLLLKSSSAASPRPELQSAVASAADALQSELTTLRGWRSAWYPGLVSTGTGSMVQHETDAEGDPGGLAATPTGTADAIGPGGATAPGTGLQPTDTGGGSAPGIGGGDSGMSQGASATGPGTQAAPPAPALVTAPSAAMAEIAVIDEMRPHLVRGLDLAHHAQAQAEHQELRDLATAMAQRFEAEMAHLDAWRALWSMGAGG